MGVEWMGGGNEFIVLEIEYDKESSICYVNAIMHYNSIINKCRCYNDATHMLPLVCVKMKDLIRSWYPLFAHEAVFTDE